MYIFSFPVQNESGDVKGSEGGPHDEERQRRRVERWVLGVGGQQFKGKEGKEGKGMVHRGNMIVNKHDLFSVRFFGF